MSHKALVLMHWISNFSDFTMYTLGCIMYQKDITIIYIYIYNCSQIHVNDNINTDQREKKLTIYRYQKGNLPHMLYDVKTKVSRFKYIDKEWKELKHSFVYISHEEMMHNCFIMSDLGNKTSHGMRPKK